MALSSTALRYDNFLLDLDGCVWVGGVPTERAKEAVAALRAAGKQILFVTNDHRATPEGFVRKLWSLGIQASLDELLSAGVVLQDVLSQEQKRRSAYVVGSKALIEHVADAGMMVVNNTASANRAELVIVGCHDGVHYRELTIAVQAIANGGELIGITRDPAFPMPDGPWPGAGAILAAVENASGATAKFTAGKPDPAIYKIALSRFGKQSKTIAVGDRLDSDIEGAIGAGIDSALVLTGSSTRAEAEASELKPTYIAESLADFVLSTE